MRFTKDVYSWQLSRLSGSIQFTDAVTENRAKSEATPVGLAEYHGGLGCCLLLRSEYAAVLRLHVALDCQSNAAVTANVRQNNCKFSKMSF